jgi:hypothetical protein
MIVRNDCVQEDTISVEVNGYCTPITEIINQTPQIDCDELMVCVGPHLVSLNDLIMRVYAYVQSAQSQNQNNFNQLFNQYNSLYNFFMKCCHELIGRLTRIEKRINGLIVIRQVFIEKATIQPIRNTPIREAQSIVIQRPPVVISEERYVIDQSITNGYIDSYIRYDNYGNKIPDPYVFWLKKEDDFLRKLCPKEVPYSKGSALANAWIEKIKAVFVENNIEFDPSILTYKNIEVKYSFSIPKLSGRWVVSGQSVIDLNGNNLTKRLPIVYNKEVNGLVLEKVTKYRIDPNQRPVIGYEPVLMTYQVLNKKLNTRSLFEAGVNHWIKYS